MGVKEEVTIGVKRGVKRYSRLAVSQSRVFLKKSEYRSQNTEWQNSVVS